MKFLKFMTISFVIGLILVGCTDNKQTKVDFIGKPYTIKIDNLEKNILGEDWNRMKSHPELSISKNYWSELGSLGYKIAQKKSFYEIINTFVVVVPVQISNHDVIERSTLELRECSFMGDISESQDISKKGFIVVIANTEPEDKFKGVFVLDIEKMRKMNWLNSNNELTKDICVNALSENLEDIQRNKINPKELKISIDKLESL